MNHVDFMIHLTEQLRVEETVQEDINQLRAKYPRRQDVQLRMDRHQEVLDKRKAEIRSLMSDIANRN